MKLQKPTVLSLLLSAIILLSVCSCDMQGGQMNALQKSAKEVLCKMAGNTAHAEPPHLPPMNYSYTVPGYKWMPELSNREYYRFRSIEPEWIHNEKDFPIPQAVKAAKRTVEAELDVTYCEYTRGFVCDLDGDGLQEALLIIRAPIGYQSFHWLNGDSHYVFVNADNQAQFLLSGCDYSTDYKGENMNCRILQYPGFRHLFVSSGVMTAASGSYYSIYSIQNGVLTDEYYDYYTQIDSGSVFLVSIAPQGLGPRYSFWDTESNAYRDIGPDRMPAADFLKLFDPDKINWEQSFPSLWQMGQSSEIWPWNYSEDNIEYVQCHGGLYYHPIFKQQKEAVNDYITYRQESDGTWTICAIGGPLGDVRCEDEFPAYGVNISEAEKTAVGP